MLDADSPIDVFFFLRLAQNDLQKKAMGILQTAPATHRHSDPFRPPPAIRGGVHGPVISRGLSPWSGDGANYWGHTPSLRTAAFAESCGLPRTEGAQAVRRPCAVARTSSKRRSCAAPLGRVRPPISPAPGRDRRPHSSHCRRPRPRWAPGNLQHTKVIHASALEDHQPAAPGRRHHQLPVLALVAGDAGRSAFHCPLQSHLIRPEYFSRDFQLLPTWPRLGHSN